jgi:membrane-bound inhibitor of C-type lysozyme
MLGTLPETYKSQFGQFSCQIDCFRCVAEQGRNEMTSHISLAKLIVAGAAMLFAGQALAETPVASADFKCADGKSIAATFYASSVALKLSDGRSMTVPQAMSASGARYANKDETFVFWNKGDTAFVTEGKDGKETYSGCVAAK